MAILIARVCPDPEDLEYQTPTRRYSRDFEQARHFLSFEAALEMKAPDDFIMEINYG